MKVMVFVKATPNSEAGLLPSDEATQKMFTEMGKFNEQLAKAGIIQTARWPEAQQRRQAHQIHRRRPHDGDRRSVRGDQGAGGGLLDLGSEVAGRGHLVGEALSEPDAGRRRRARDPAVLRNGGLRAHDDGRDPRARRARAQAGRGEAESRRPRRRRRRKRKPKRNRRRSPSRPSASPRAPSRRSSYRGLSAAVFGASGR